MKRLSFSLLMLTAALVLGSLAAAALTNIFFHREISAGRVLSDGDSLTAVRFEALAGYEDYLVFSNSGEVSFNLRAALNETGSQGGFNGEALFSIGSENHELFSVTNHSDLPVQLLMIDTTGGLSLQGSPGVLSPGVTGYILQFDRVFGDFIIRPRVDGNEKSPLRDLVKARTDAYNLPGRDDDDFWTAEHEILVTVRQGVEEGSKSIDISLDGVLIYENYLIQSTLTASENHIGLRSWFTPTEYHWLSATPLD